MESYNDVYLNFLHGQWKPGSSGSWETKRTPARPAETLGKATRSTAVDVTRAIDSAVSSQAEWARRPRPARGALLQHAAQVLKHKAENIAKTIARETGRDLKDARAEVQKAVVALELVASEARRPQGGVLPAESTQTLAFTSRLPRGIVAVITPWAFPVLTPARQLAAALMEGNAVVFKPSTLVPASTTMLVRAFEEASLPVGVLNLVFGQGPIVGRALVEEPRIAAISFTGTAPVAQEIAQLAAKRLARLELQTETRGVAVVCAGANLDHAAEEIARSAFGAAGSRPGAIARVLVATECFEPLMQKLAAHARSFKPVTGEGTHTLAPLPDDRRLTASLTCIEDAVKTGATLACGGERLALADAGFHLTPTVLAESTEARVALLPIQDAIVGPVVSVRAVQSIEEARAVIHGSRSTLSSVAIFSREPSRFLADAAAWNTRLLQANCADTETGPRVSDLYAEIQTLALAAGTPAGA